MAITPLVNERIGAIESAEQKIKDGIYILAQLFDPTELELICKVIINADHSARTIAEQRTIIRQSGEKSVINLYPFDMSRVPRISNTQTPLLTKKQQLLVQSSNNWH